MKRSVREAQRSACGESARQANLIRKRPLGSLRLQTAVRAWGVCALGGKGPREEKGEGKGPHATGRGPRVIKTVRAQSERSNAKNKSACEEVLMTRSPLGVLLHKIGPHESILGPNVMGERSAEAKMIRARGEEDHTL